MGALAMSEANAGSDVVSMRCRADKKGASPGGGGPNWQGSLRGLVGELDPGDWGGRRSQGYWGREERRQDLGALGLGKQPLQGPDWRDGGGWIHEG